MIEFFHLNFSSSDSDVEEALKILSEGGEKYKEEYLNVEAADRVLQRFGMPSYMPRCVLRFFVFCSLFSIRFFLFRLVL
jgi:hypothetical protein